MTRIVLRLALLALLLTPRAATAQDSRQNAPGRLDFYVLSLSWSPSFCAEAAERNARSATANVQCGPRPYSFVVPGLWPQYDDGFPEYCRVPAPRLIYDEWDRHGTCSGQSPRAYFDTVRKARAVVKIPPEFTDRKEPLSVTPRAVEEAFIKANPDRRARWQSAATPSVWPRYAFACRRICTSAIVRRLPNAAAAASR